MKFKDKKFFLVTLATLILPNFPCVKVAQATDAEIFVIDEDYKITKSSAQNWLNLNQTEELKCFVWLVENLEMNSF